MSQVNNHTQPASFNTGPLAYGVFFVSFSLFALTSSPAIGWLDSPEFVAQATTLGIAHSPGHPLPALLGHLAQMIPIGDLVWRVNLMSSLCAALAVSILSLSVQVALGPASLRMGERPRSIIAGSLALCACASVALWSNAVRAEVYALQSLISVVALYALLRYEESPEPRWLLVAAFTLALGLANHHLLALTILVPALLFILIRPKRPALKMSLRAAFIGMLGLCALWYLPVRSLTHPEVNFGAPHTLGRFLWTLSGAAFRGSANFSHASSPMVDSIQVLVALQEAIPISLLLFSLYGVWATRGNNARRRVSRLLLSIAVLCCAVRVLLGFDPETPDHHAYLLPAIFALYLLAASGIGHLISLALSAQRPLPKAPVLTSIALILLVPIQVASHWREADLSRAWASDDMAHWELESVPPRSLILLAYFQTSFRIWALHSVEGMRPDVAILDRSFLSYPGMREEAALRDPELSGLIEAPLQAGVPSPISMLREVAARRPLRVQMHSNVDPQLAAILRPSGPWASLGGDRNRDLKLSELLAERLLREVAPAEREAARGALLWHDATRLNQLCMVGEKAWAQKVLEDALQIAPKDQLLGQIAEHCGLHRM